MRAERLGFEVLRNKVLMDGKVDIMDMRDGSLAHRCRSLEWAEKICAMLNEELEEDEESERMASEDKRCCQLCIKFETVLCPIKEAYPWSRWSNYCNLFSEQKNA